MKYSLFNIKRLRDNFDSIRAVGGKDLTNDVYARDPDTDTFWFIGKVARVSGEFCYSITSEAFIKQDMHSAWNKLFQEFPKLILVLFFLLIVSFFRCSD